MGALHGLNPYTHDSGTVVSDAVFPFVRWDRFTSPYGPLFTLLSYAYVPLGLAASLWAMKATAILASLGICGLIWEGAGQLGLNRGTAVALYGLNPTVIVYGLGGAHNDLLATAIVLAGAILVLRGRDGPGGAVSALAVAVKASSAAVLPFLVLGAQRRAGGARRRRGRRGRHRAGRASRIRGPCRERAGSRGPPAEPRGRHDGDRPARGLARLRRRPAGRAGGGRGRPRRRGGRPAVADLAGRSLARGRRLGDARHPAHHLLAAPPGTWVWLMPAGSRPGPRAHRCAIAAVAMSAFVGDHPPGRSSRAVPTSADLGPLVHPAGRASGSAGPGVRERGTRPSRWCSGHCAGARLQAPPDQADAPHGQRPACGRRRRERYAKGALPGRHPDTRWSCYIKYFLRGTAFERFTGATRRAVAAARDLAGPRQIRRAARSSRSPRRSTRPPASNAPKAARMSGSQCRSHLGFMCRR